MLDTILFLIAQSDICLGVLVSIEIQTALLPVKILLAFDILQEQGTS